MSSSGIWSGNPQTPGGNRYGGGCTDKKTKIIDCAKVLMHLSFYVHFGFLENRQSVKKKVESSSRSWDTADRGLWITTGSEIKSSSAPLAISVATAFFNTRTEYSPTPSTTAAHSTNWKSRTFWHPRNALRCLRYWRALLSLSACDARTKRPKIGSSNGPSIPQKSRFL